MHQKQRIFSASPELLQKVPSVRELLSFYSNKPKQEPKLETYLRNKKLIIKIFFKCTMKYPIFISSRIHLAFNKKQTGWPKHEQKPMAESYKNELITFSVLTILCRDHY